MDLRLRPLGQPALLRRLAQSDEGEAAGKLCWYDADGKRNEAKDVYPEIRSDE